MLLGSTPDLFKQQVTKALDEAAKRTGDDRIVFVKSWNEWAEGNYMEPDTQFGHGYLKALRDALFTGGS